MHAVQAPADVRHQALDTLLELSSPLTPGSQCFAAGLWDPHVDVHMGECAELCAQHYQISREEMDDHAIQTFQRAQAAAPYSRAEVVPVKLPPSKAEPSSKVLEQDESLGKIDAQKLRGLKPFFKQV